jgi:hypothetical protein
MARLLSYGSPIVLPLHMAVLETWLSMSCGLVVISLFDTISVFPLFGIPHFNAPVKERMVSDKPSKL